MFFTGNILSYQWVQAAQIILSMILKVNMGKSKGFCHVYIFFFKLRTFILEKRNVCFKKKNSRVHITFV